MLQVTENGANITLSGKTGGQGNGVFWFASWLMAGAGMWQCRPTYY